MLCQEKFSPENRRENAHLNLFFNLHQEGKSLISGWFQRAWNERECSPSDSFEPFIFAWFAFNGWAACVTNCDTDRQIINALGSDIKINEDFSRAMQSKIIIETNAHILFNFLPIFDVKNLRRKGLINYQQQDRRTKVLSYLENPFVKYEPECWKAHFDAGETMPIDWYHLLNAIYKIRCNLFHGSKDVHSEMDQRIVHSGYLILIHFIMEANYLQLNSL